MLILNAIGVSEGIEVSDDEVKERIDQLAKNTSMKSEDIVKMYVAQDGSLDGFKQQLYTDKVLDIVMSKAIIKKKSSLIV
jgi:FKBP-type peptidyl-prolyl cis-trans isomerase (trigger factor)